MPVVKPTNRKNTVAPRPWRIGGLGTNILDADGDQIALVCGMPPIGNQGDTANAAHIVEAVNKVEELRAIIVTAITDLQSGLYLLRDMRFRHPSYALVFARDPDAAAKYQKGRYGGWGKVPISLRRSRERYQEWLRADSGLSFREWMRRPKQ